jgi:nitrate/nitrite transport system ATP-binding protein
MPLLSLRNVCKGFGEGENRTEVLRNVNLDIESGELVAIVGFSGSGKTTLLSMIAGLTRPDSGEILFDGKPVMSADPSRGVVFQNYSLLPWLTVFENVALGVDQVFHDWPKDKRREHVLRYVAMVGLTPALRKKPPELSGGMRQRVSLARTLAITPRMLLLDEPLSALDALTRGTLQQEIQSILNQDQKTVLLITNDVDESILLADRIIPLTIGPRATLAEPFVVDLPRPRIRAELNQDPHFQRIRNDVVGCLVELRDRARRGAGASILPPEPKWVGAAREAAEAV